MIIREMRPDELPLIIQIYVETFKATHQDIVSETFLNTLSYENALPRFAGILKKTERYPFCAVAEDRGKVIGYALGALAGNPPPGYQSELKTMYVLPDYHRRGIGHDLLRSLTEHFLHRSITSLFVETFQNNYPAARFYRTLGAHKIQDHQEAINGENFTLTAYGWSSMYDLNRRLTL